jgi:serine protease Do
MSHSARYTTSVTRSSTLAGLLVGLTTLLVVGGASGGPPPGAPPLPAPGAKGGAPPPAAAPVANPQDPIERARRGVVTIERAGEQLALGSVLRNDGRVLTALSSLGDGNSLTVRFPDGTVVPARVGHRDRVWDLALLVPQVGRWPEGMNASDTDALRQGAQLRGFTNARGRIVPATVVFKGRRDLLGADDQVIRGVYEVPTKVGPKEFGSPVVDEAGGVIAILGRACVPAEKGPCTPTAFGVPVEALRQFLRTTPISAVPPAPWLGIRGSAEKAGNVQGVRVLSVSPDSPAAEAGLRAGADPKNNDLVVAIDNQPVATPDALTAVIRSKSVGERIKLLVLGPDGRFRESQATLRPVPAQQGTKLSAVPLAETGGRELTPLLSHGGRGTYPWLKPGAVISRGNGP